MHRLLTKKHRDDDQPKTTNKLRSFKRNKSQPPPASRPQVDLTQALPPTDDFRISLMMPNLEKRFSVLRDGEKNPDGPGVNGIGYGALASGTLFNDGNDDQYVRPPYGGGLGDITEVSSIRSGSRAGSLDQERSSQNEDYSGSMMNRPRQGDGNVLFGGRQKVYRINTAATQSSEEIESPISPIGRGRMGGRALYTDDLPGSNGNWRKGSPGDKESPRGQSPPPTNYNLDRNTQSSTASGPTSLTRSSTTATSNSTNSRNFTPITPVHPNISTTSNKPRKPIYEQALDRDISEQNSLDSQRLAIMAQRRAGSTSPNPYSEEHEKMRAMSPPPRSYTRPFSPSGHSDLDSRGRSSSPASNLRAPQSRDNIRQIPGLRMDSPKNSAPSKSETPSDIPFSFGFEEKTSQPTIITSKSVANNHGLPTPRPESDEYQAPSTSIVKPLVTSHPTPSPSPLTEKYPKPASISQKSDSNLHDTFRPESKGSSASNSSKQQPKMHSATFFEASDSEHEMDDGASSVYEDDVGSVYDDQFSHGHLQSSPPQRQNATVSDFQFPKMRSNPASPITLSPQEVALHESDSPTLPPNAGLSNMIRQHLRSDSGISSIYAPSTYRKMSEPHPDPPSLAKALAGWDNQYGDYDEEAPFQSDNTSERSEPKPKYSLAELKKKEAEEKKRQQEEQPLAVKSAPMERKVSNNTASTGDEDDEHDEWRNQLAEKKRMLQQRLQEHSGRNSPAPGFADSSEDLSKGSILKPGMLGNMLKGKGSPAGTPMGGRDDSKAMKMLGISPMLNQSKDSFKRRDEEEDFARESHEKGPRPMRERPDMNGPSPQEGRPRGPGPMHHQGAPRGPPGPQGPIGRPYGAQPVNGPMGSPRSFLPMTGPPSSGRRGGGHIPIEAGIPNSTNMHREFMEQGRGGHGPRGPGMPPHMQHRGPPPHGYEQPPHQEFRPPHDRPYDGRGPMQQGPRSRARSNAQRPNDAMPRSPPQSRGGPIRRGTASEEDLRGRQRGPPPRGGPPPMGDHKSGVTTTVTSGSAPAPLNFEKKAQGTPRGGDLETSKIAEPSASVTSLDAKKTDSPGRIPRLATIEQPPAGIPQPKFSGNDSTNVANNDGRVRSNSKPVQYSSVGIFDMNAAGQPSIPVQSNTSTPSKLAASSSGSPGKTLAEYTGADNPSSQFQSQGSALASREGKKTKIKKTDISEPRLMHTTSQMPVSNLIDAGGKAPKILPPGLGDSPQLRQRSGSDESASRIPRAAQGYPQNQRTSDPEGERTRGLRKATSDGSGLRERAASSARSRPAMPEIRSPVYRDPTAQAPPQFFSNAPAGMI